MKRVMTMVALVMSLASAFDAIADCVYGGRSYPTGTRNGNLTCQANGTWR